MAKQIIHRLIDDLDGSDADETVSIALDGISYEIDLTEAHASTLREFLGTYVAAGTRTGRVNSTPQLSRGVRPVETARSRREESTAIRAWALNNGYPLADRGRIPQEIVEAFHKRSQGQQDFIRGLAAASTVAPPAAKAATKVLAAKAVPPATFQPVDEPKGKTAKGRNARVG